MTPAAAAALLPASKATMITKHDMARRAVVTYLMGEIEDVLIVALGASVHPARSDSMILTCTSENKY